MNKSNWLKTAVLGVSLVTVSFAQTAPTIEDAPTALTAAVTAAGVIAGSIAALSAAVMAWKKIRSYFNRAG